MVLTLAMFVVILAALTVYSMILLAVCGGKAYQNGFHAGQRDEATAREGHRSHVRLVR